MVLLFVGGAWIVSTVVILALRESETDKKIELEERGRWSEHD
jgi:hypothetical protein